MRGWDGLERFMRVFPWVLGVVAVTAAVAIIIRLLS